MEKRNTRAIQFEIPAEGESVPAVLSSETPVKRGSYKEILSHNPTAIDLSRFPLPLLVCHNQAMLPIGVAESPIVEGGKLRATIKFGSSDLAKQVLEDVRNRIVRAISIGYSILDDKENGDTITATRWMPYEASVVPAPADIAAGFFRNLTETNPMTTHTHAGSIDHSDPTPTHQDPTPVHADPARIRREERKRAHDIDLAASRAGLSSDYARSLIASDLTSQQAHNVIMTEWSNRVDASATHSGIIQGGENFGGMGANSMRDAASDALLMRAGIRVDAPHPQAANLRNVSFVDIARSFLRESGDLIGAGTPSQILHRAMTTSNFPSVLEQVTDKSLLSAFYDMPPSHFQWSAARDAQYFRPQHFASISDAPKLEQVLEGAEYPYGPLHDGKESVPLLKFGKIISLTWEALSRDDLSVFTNVAASMAAAARSIMADHAYATLTGNPAMNDGKPLFHADHGNLAASGGPISVETLDAARLAMRTATGANGHFRDIRPSILLVPESMLSLAESMLMPFNPTTTADIRPRWMQSLIVVSDPRLTGNEWYLLGDMSQPAFVRLTLGGTPIETFRDEGFDIDGTKFKVRTVFGFGAVDHQAAYKNPGEGG